MAGLPPIGGGPLGVAEQERKSHNVGALFAFFVFWRMLKTTFWMRQKTKKPLRAAFSLLLRRQDSNLRPLGYEPNELPLLHSAI